MPPTEDDDESLRKKSWCSAGITPDVQRDRRSLFGLRIGQLVFVAHWQGFEWLWSFPFRRTGDTQDVEFFFIKVCLEVQGLLALYEAA